MLLQQQHLISEDQCRLNKRMNTRESRRTHIDQSGGFHLSVILCSISLTFTLIADSNSSTSSVPFSCVCVCACPGHDLCLSIDNGRPLLHKLSILMNAAVRVVSQVQENGEEDDGEGEWEELLLNFNCNNFQARP